MVGGSRPAEDGRRCVDGGATRCVGGSRARPPSACAADGQCDDRPLADIPESDRPPGLTTLADALAASAGTWTSSFDGETVALTLATDVDAIVVSLVDAACVGGGPAQSTVQVGDGSAEADQDGVCNLSIREGDAAWCEFETETGSWELTVEPYGTMRADVAATVLGGTPDDDVGVTIGEWTFSG